MLQHAWAEFEHAMRYKGEIPDEQAPELDRRFTLAAGLLELADREFSAIHEALRRTGTLRQIGGVDDDPRIGGEDLATFLTERYREAGWSRPDHYTWISGLLLELGITSVEELEALLDSVDAEEVAERMAYRYPPGAVRRLDDALLVRYGEQYVHLHGNAHRRTRSRPAGSGCAPDRAAGSGAAGDDEDRVVGQAFERGQERAAAPRRGLREPRVLHQLGDLVTGGFPIRPTPQEHRRWPSKCGVVKYGVLGSATSACLVPSSGTQNTMTSSYRSPVSGSKASGGRSRRTRSSCRRPGRRAARDLRRRPRAAAPARPRARPAPAQDATPARSAPCSTPSRQRRTGPRGSSRSGHHGQVTLRATARFDTFGPEHLVLLGIFLVGLVVVVAWGRRHRGHPGRGARTARLRGGARTGRGGDAGLPVHPRRLRPRHLAAVPVVRRRHGRGRGGAVARSWRATAFVYYVGLTLTVQGCSPRAWRRCFHTRASSASGRCTSWWCGPRST